ncbi:hypothetical protein [Streptomyces sp. NPDC127098]|uniref:hypothetical protein n=1 Tax=Streptomyces sp. NPDC127098 TaxID=3347137 RepID=UPI003651A416
MSDDGLCFIPERFRESGRMSLDAAEEAEVVRRQLGNAQPEAGRFGGADAFVASLNATRDRQRREVGQAAEGRENMSDADHRTADIGEETDVAAEAAVVRADTAVARAIADGI